MCVRPSVHMEQLGSYWADFHDIWYVTIFRISVEKLKFHFKSDKKKGYFTWRPTYIFIIWRSFLLTMRHVSDKSWREKQNMYFVFRNFFFGNRTVYETMWKNTVELAGPHMTIWHRRIACWIPKATNTHNKAVLFYSNNGCRKAPQCYFYVHYLSCLFCSDYNRRRTSWSPLVTSEIYQNITRN